MIVPALAVMVSMPLLSMLVLRRPLPPPWPRSIAWIALGLGLISSAATHWSRSHRRGAVEAGSREPSPEARAAERSERRTFAFLSVGLLYAAACLLVLAAAWTKDPHHALPCGFDAWFGWPPSDAGLGAAGELPSISFLHRFVHASTWTLAVPVLGALIGRQLGSRNHGARGEVVPEAFAFLGSGLVAAVLLAWLSGDPWSALIGAAEVNGGAATIFGVTAPAPVITALVSSRYVLTVLGVPLLLGVYALSRAVFTAIRSKADDLDKVDVSVSEADREWWARITSRVLCAAVLWMAGSVLALLGVWWVVQPAQARDGVGWIAAALGGVGGVSGAVTAVLGKSPGTSSGRAGGGHGSRTQLRVLGVAAPLGVASAVVVLSMGMTWLGSRPPPYGGGPDLAKLLWVDALFLAIALIAGAVVNINRFSLHGLYRNRLVRAFLGASNLGRRPSAISGFDPEDDALRLADLRPESGDRAPLPIFGATMNVLHGQRLAWQERKAESFSMTPLYCGSFRHGYRDSGVYGRPGGIRLGTAMAISGAAANPNMGYLSSPALTFLMGLLNARLGVWLPNPGRPGDGVVSRAAPGQATMQLLRELCGLTDADSPYVNLSDGGHFDNLGLYEVVLRRCRRVVVSDASCDPAHHLADLGNAVRKIRIDFGIPIELGPWVRLPCPRKETRRPLAYASWGVIRYAAADGPRAPDGHLLYLKVLPARSDLDQLPCDVQAYAWRARRFPHESTADQWFSESQFESYRALGEYLASQLTGGQRLDSVQALFDGPAPTWHQVSLSSIVDRVQRSLIPKAESMRPKH